MADIKLMPLHAGQREVYAGLAKRTVLRIGRRFGKALALDTPIPTPKGWTTMGELKPGDTVYDEQGLTCNVTFITEVQHGRPCNRVEFSDGTVIIADDDHQWLTWDRCARKNAKRNARYVAKTSINGKPRNDHPKVRTTREIRETLGSGNRGDTNHSIPTAAIQGSAWQFLIPPYVLGVWLGDGSSAGIVLTCNDQQIIDELGKEGQPAYKYTSTYAWGLCTPGHEGKEHGVNLKSKLQKIGVLNNKHIPANYLRSSYSQRLALLQGLMDTDGSASPKGHCEFTNCNKALADGVLELVLSLGIRATMSTGRATLYGKDCGPKYRIKFTTGLPVFRLQRKLDRQQVRSKSDRNVDHRFIVRVEPVESVPVKCIQVDSPSHLYLASRSFIPTHNTALLEVIAEYAALRGERIGLFFPDLTRAQPVYQSICATLKPAIRSSNKTDLMIELITGGQIEMWSLQDEHAGRSRWYHKALIDEASLVPDLESIFNLSIAPTLLDRNGDAIIAGTPLGADEESFFYRCCMIKEPSSKWPTIWTEFHKPTSSNPLLNAEAVAALKTQYPPLVYQQEYEALFVSWSGASLIKLESLLVNGQGVPFPGICDAVFCTIDTAVKDGTENDGTAVCYWAISKFVGHPLVLLDWSIEQVTADLQTKWLPSIFNRLEELSKQCRARYGSIGCYIEDKQSGQMLLQHGERVGWPTVAIPGDLTQIGKSGRASLASGPVFQGRVKLSQQAFDKTCEYKAISRNHLVSQITSFSLGDKLAYKRADDLADAAFYGILIALEGAQPLLC